MKVAVIGATGRTGLECTKQLLSQGHSVVAIVRSEEKAYNVFSCIPRAERARLQVTEIANFEKDKLTTAFTDCESIIFTSCGVSFLGLFNRSGGPKYVDYGGVVACIEVINSLPQKPKFILISSLGVTRPYWPIYIMLNTLGGRVMTYKLRGEDALRAANLPHYTIIRPGRLVPTEKNPSLVDSELVVSQGDRITGQILREDVARVAVHCALVEEAADRCTFELISAASTNIEPEHAGNVQSAPGRSKQCPTLLQDLKTDLQITK